jgi:Ca2+/Na+ antiporter
LTEIKTELTATAINNKKCPMRRKLKMKTWKLVSGILSIIMFIVVGFQSCAAGISNTMEANGEVGGSAGVIVAIMLLAGGIVSVVTRKGTKGGNIALIVLYGLGGLFGFALAGSYADLNIWAGWCLICAVLAVVSLVISKKERIK